MFKAPIKVLHPLLTATQEGNYIGTETLGPIPFNGIILAHSNEAEWQVFKANKNNEAFLDRICVITVPYCLRVTEEVQIYKKLLRESQLDRSPCAPETLEMLGRFCVLTRLKEHENSNLYSKMRVYDGEKLSDTDPKAKTLQEYKDAAGVDEGMTGLSTRFAYKTLSETFNFDHSEIAADPVHLMYVLEQSIRREQFPDETEKKYLEFIKAELAPRYAEFIGKEIQKAYLESYGEYGQNLFDRYIAYADAWIEDQDFKDADTGQLLDRNALDAELSKIEKPAGIANPKDFRNEVVKFALRYRAQHDGKNPQWTAYEKIRTVIEKRMFTQVEDLLPVISFESKKDSDTETKHNEFVKRMLARGYTPTPGAPARRMVHARQQGGVESPHKSGCHDRLLHRSPAQSEGQEPRQPAAVFAPRARANPRSRAEKPEGFRMSPTRARTARSRISTQGTREPRFRLDPAKGGDRDFVLPGNKEFIAGDQIKKPQQGQGGGRQGRGRPRARGTMISNSPCARKKFSTFSSRISNSRISSAPRSPMRRCPPGSVRHHHGRLADPDQSAAHHAQFIRPPARAAQAEAVRRQGTRGGDRDPRGAGAAASRRNAAGVPEGPIWSVSTNGANGSPISIRSMCASMPSSNSRSRPARR